MDQQQRLRTAAMQNVSNRAKIPLDYKDYYDK